MDQLQDLIKCGVEWAEKRAQIALNILAQRNSGEISQDEAEELLGDLIATDKLELIAGEIKIKAALVNAISIALKLA